VKKLKRMDPNVERWMISGGAGLAVVLLTAAYLGQTDSETMREYFPVMTLPLAAVVALVFRAWLEASHRLAERWKIALESKPHLLQAILNVSLVLVGGVGAILLDQWMLKTTIFTIVGATALLVGVPIFIWDYFNSKKKE
jgi:hypothetical protein